VSWDDVRYSVPYSAVLDLVVVRATEAELFVYGDDLSEIARHGRKPRGWPDPVLDPSHHPPRIFRLMVQSGFRVRDKKRGQPFCANFR
jgi:hypothetical protein